MKNFTDIIDKLCYHSDIIYNPTDIQCKCSNQITVILKDKMCSTSIFEGGGLKELKCCVQRCGLGVLHHRRGKVFGCGQLSWRQLVLSEQCRLQVRTSCQKQQSCLLASADVSFLSLSVCVCLYLFSCLSVSICVCWCLLVSFGIYLCLLVFVGMGWCFLVSVSIRLWF